MRIKNLIQYSFEYGIFFTLKSTYYARKKSYQNYHKTIKNYLEKHYKQQIEYFENYSSALTSNSVPAQKVIWLFWWDGIDKSPEIVKCCFRSIKKNAGGRKVLVLTKDNFHQYVKLPEFIIEKFHRGYISLAQFSDIIRIHLLCNHGGIWLDATIFLSDDLPESYGDYLFFSRHSQHGNLQFAAEGRWTGYFMAASHTHTLLFEYLRTICEAYWEKQNVIISYFLLDYLIAIAYDHFLPVRSLIDQIPINNPNIKKLSAEMNHPYDDMVWKNICTDTYVHKLSWKKKAVMESEGQDTYYKKLLAAYCDD